jgi:hypothetical protein
MTLEIEEIPMIRAKCYSDDFTFETEFDAEPFFLQASNIEIVNLARCGWGGDYPADALVYYFENMAGYEDITQLLSYISVKDNMGFECHVQKDDVLKWASAKRPDLFAQLNIITGGNSNTSMFHN